MKKQVTFEESQTVHWLHQDEALARSIGMNESKKAGCEPQLQDITTIQIPKTMTAAPFLKHTALTPAQKEYLYAIAASHSPTHVRNLITQHYMNVLHRCVRSGYKSEREDPVVPSSVISPGTDKSNKHRSGVTSPAKHKDKINTSASNPGKPLLQKIPSSQSRRSTTSASKQTKMEKRTTTSATLRRKSPKRGRIKLLQRQEKEEEEQDESLSECLSSLSMGEWDEDTFSDL